jgi:hypothetical protein
VGDKTMATAADYRKWDEECFEWARQASDESVRDQYAKMGQHWLEQLARTESGAVISPQPKTAVA